LGIKDLFSSSGRQKSRLDKSIKTAINKYTQSAERYGAMEALLADGSEEALVGLMKRFTVVSTKSIEDEEEKGWAYRQLSGLGAKVLPAAKAFCLEHDNIAWALRIIEDVADEAQEWEILDALLAQHPPGYERDPSKKIQLLTHLAEIEEAGVPLTLASYLADTDEGVRFLCVEQLLDIGDEAQTKQALVERLLDDNEDSLRLRTRVLDGLADLGWDISQWSDKLAAKLGNEHQLQGGKIQRR
jgi:hypothetical protein